LYLWDIPVENKYKIVNMGSAGKKTWEAKVSTNPNERCATKKREKLEPFTLRFKNQIFKKNDSMFYVFLVSKIRKKASRSI
jgi:hypothetical protein